MSSYLNSSYITVFPATRRADDYVVTSKIMSEANATSFINTVIDTDGFVITKQTDLSLNAPFEFNIHGYYVKINQLSNLVGNSSAVNLYACIDLDRSSSPYIEISGQDSSGKYYGISFEGGQAGALTHDYYLHLLTRTSSSSTDWTIPTGSKIKFKSDSIEGGGSSDVPDINVIDGGTI